MSYFYYGVLLINVLAVLMILLRPAIFGTTLYRPMLKNVLLSILPVLVLLLTFFISVNLAYRGYQAERRYLVYAGFCCGVAGFAVWLLLLPNAGYLITELNLNHRSIDKKEVPLWYDIISVLTLSMSGVVNTLVNVMLVQMLYVSLFHPTQLGALNFSSNPLLWLMAAAVFVLVGFGIYIGRYIRFNSWDVLRPRRMLKKFAGHVREKGTIKNMLLFVVFYALFFFVMYMIVIIPAFNGGLVW